MTASTLISCAIAGILTLTTLHAAPQFRSLTPGTQTRSWVSDLNHMNESERQRRVQTFGMPKAPPNRWAKRSAPPRQVAPIPHHPSEAAQPASLYQNRRRNIVPAKVLPARPIRQVQPVRQQAQTVMFTPPAKRSRLLPWKASQVKNKPKVQPIREQAQTVMFTPPAKRSRLLPWKASQVKNKPKVQTRQELLRQQVAFMPNNRSGGAALPNPWAPYGSQAEYERAISRSKWEPRARSADMLRKQKQQRRSPRASTKAKSTSKPKRRWSLGSIFKKKKSPSTASTKRSSKKQAPATRSNTSPRLPNSKMVTTGLPQTNDSGSPIQTTLFGN